MLYAPLPVIINLLLRIYAVTGPYVSPSNVQLEPIVLVNVRKASVFASATTVPSFATPENVAALYDEGAVVVVKYM